MPRTTTRTTARTTRRPAARPASRTPRAPRGQQVRINGYIAGSGAVRHFKEGLIAAGISAQILKRTGSRFIPQANDIIINYGDSGYVRPNGLGTLLNHPEAIALASNKLNFFGHVTAWNNTNEDRQVSLVPNTGDIAVAREWQAAGETVYVRGSLTGHSGEGITVVSDRETDMPRARLYTKGITGSRREYRVHVFNGKPILVQLKKRRNGFAELENASDTVRNLNGGWVFAVSDAQMSSVVRDAATNVITALGLDFGAVDIIAKGRKGQEREAWVLEVNTAPGQQGDTTTERYVAAIQGVISGEAFDPYADLTNVVEAAAEAVAPAPEPEPAPEAPRRGRGRTRREPEPEVVPAPATTATVIQDNMNSSFANGVHYFITVAGERTVGRYDRESNQFYIIGEETPISAADALHPRRTQEI